MADPTSTPGAVEPDDATPPIDLAAMRERYEQARAWYGGPHAGWKFASQSSDDVPALLAEVERLRALTEGGFVREAWQETRNGLGIDGRLVAVRDMTPLVADLRAERDALLAGVEQAMNVLISTDFAQRRVARAATVLRALLDRDRDDHRQTAPSGPPQSPQYRTAIAVNDVVATICHDKPLSEKTEAALEALVRAASASLGDEPAPQVAQEAPDGPGASQGHRCASCDHHANMHTPEGCWYTVSAADNGRNLVCVCNVAYNNPHPGDATEETTDA